MKHHTTAFYRAFERREVTKVAAYGLKIQFRDRTPLPKKRTNAMSAFHKQASNMPAHESGGAGNKCGLQSISAPVRSFGPGFFACDPAE
jgi:hypothetical protein